MSIGASQTPIEAFPHADQSVIAGLRANSGIAKNLNAEAAANFSDSDTVIISGHTLAAGKSALIAVLEENGWKNKPSLTTRELRPGEVEGVDKITVSLAEMLDLSESGQLLELEEMRPGVFYATSADFEPGVKYVKDTELNGAASLRTIKPDAKVVIPIPPATKDKYGVYDWEKRIIKRDKFSAYLPEAKYNDVVIRLGQAIPDLIRIRNEKYTQQKNTLVIINDDLTIMHDEVVHFLETGKPLSQKRSAVAATINELIGLLEFTLAA